MTLQLDATAQYYQAGDYTAVAIYLVENNLLKGSLVVGGTAELRSQDTRRTLATIEFEKKQLNEDGYFTVLFIRPPEFMGTKIHIELTDTDGLDYTKEVPVIFEAAKATGLADSPATQIDSIGTIEGGIADQFDIFDARRNAKLDLES